MKEIVLDTETTGLSVKDGHRIVEIGCIELEDLVPTKNIFHCYLNPGRKVSQEAFEVHGYTDNFLSDKKKFEEIADDFLEFLKDKKIVIHNAGFDIAHINNELNILGREKISNKNIVDTLELARNKFPGSSTSLDALCKRYKIDNSKRTKHTALIDCELLGKVYINLLGQKEPTLNFSSISDVVQTNKNSNKIFYSKKIIFPNIDEKKKHKEYLKRDFKKTFFN